MDHYLAIKEAQEDNEYHARQREIDMFNLLIAMQSKYNVSMWAFIGIYTLSDSRIDALLKYYGIQYDDEVTF